MNTATIHVDASNGLTAVGIGVIVIDHQNRLVDCVSVIKPVKTHSHMAESYGIELALTRAQSLLKIYDQVLVINDNMGTVNAWNRAIRGISPAKIPHLVPIDLLKTLNRLATAGKLVLKHACRESSVSHKLADRLSRFALRTTPHISVVTSFADIVKKSRYNKATKSKFMDNIEIWTNGWKSSFDITTQHEVRRLNASSHCNSIYQPGFSEAMQLEQQMVDYFN